MCIVHACNFAFSDHTFKEYTLTCSGLETEYEGLGLNLWLLGLGTWLGLACNDLGLDLRLYSSDLNHHSLLPSVEFLNWYLVVSVWDGLCTKFMYFGEKVFPIHPIKCFANDFRIHIYDWDWAGTGWEFGDFIWCMFELLPSGRWYRSLQNSFIPKAVTLMNIPVPT